MNALAVVAGDRPEDSLVIAGGFSFGLAAWRLDALLRPTLDDDGTYDLLRFIPATQWPLIQSVRFGSESLLACAGIRDGDVRLFRAGDLDHPTLWRAHSHHVTAIAESGTRLWTGDTWGNVRVWTAPVSSPGGMPTLHTEVRTRAPIVDVMPIDDDSALIATDSGFVAVDLRHGA